jgi:hypothetical protein
MTATSQSPLIEAIGTPTLQSRLAYLFQGTMVTTALLKIKALFFKTKSARWAPDPDDRKDPPQSADLEDCWNDPKRWMLLLPY